jgi:UPF0755 protein
MIKRSIAAFTLLMLIALGLIWWGMHHHLTLKRPVVPLEMLFEIERGDSLDAICRKLQEQGISIRPFWFKLFAYQHHLAQQLKAGEYLIPKNFTEAEILNLFNSGKTRQYTITFPEGWSYKQVLREVQNNPHLRHTITGREDKNLLSYIGSDKPNPEGLFYPDTYFFEKHTADVELLKRAHEKMQLVLNEEWKKRASQLPLEDPYQALILASIIEKETAAVEERKQIAGVFTRRLKKGMLLQTDPTVIYGMGDKYHGDISHKDLREPTPYNTYINSGLPPTPIAMPGKEAIVAALHPDDANSLFFVSRGNGRHAFSATLAEHERYVDRYQR